MARIEVVEEGAVGAPAELVYRCIADHEQHQRFLPPAFSDFRIEEGGDGAGTVTSFKVRAGGGTRAFRMRVEEPEPGRVLTESDTHSDLVTTWTVTPEGERACRVEIRTAWTADGAVGVLERLFAPRAMRALYAEELDRLDDYARSRTEPPDGRTQSPDDAAQPPDGRTQPPDE
jgi:ribosome-associated toxin RatA of RatAB toxin-antitoxin module